LGSSTSGLAIKSDEVEGEVVERDAVAAFDQATEKWRPSTIPCDTVSRLLSNNTADEERDKLLASCLPS
jgi:hypothetical protein